MKKPRGKQEPDNLPRVNEQINNLETIRLIDADGEALGVVDISVGFAKAEEAGLDLVEISAKANPPVCKVQDFTKFKYDLAKKAKDQKKKQHIIQVKEIKFRPKTENHDYEYKLKHIKEFLEHGDRVKVSVFFRGREMAYLDYGKAILDRVVEDLKDYADPEFEPKMEKKTMLSVFVPKKSIIKRKEKVKPVQKKHKHLEKLEKKSSVEDVQETNEEINNDINKEGVENA